MRGTLFLLAVALLLAFCLAPRPASSAITLTGSNWAYSTLGTAVSNAAPSLSVGSGQGIRFPASGNFRAVLFDAACISPAGCADREIMTLTHSSGDTFNIINRGQEGTTTPPLWVSGSQIWAPLTEGRLDEIDNDLSGIEGGTYVLNNIRTKGPWVDVRAYGATGNGVTDDSAALQNAINAAHAAAVIANVTSLSAGAVNGQTYVTVYAPTGSYLIKSALSVTAGVDLRFEGEILNGLTNATAPGIVFHAFSACDLLKYNAQTHGGVLFGDANTQNQIRIGYANVAQGSYNPVSGVHGVKFQGWNFVADRLEVNGFDHDVDMASASDVRFGQVIVVGGYSGLVLSGCEHIFVSFLDADTVDQQGIAIDGSDDINLRGTIWYNDSGGAPAIATAALIGYYSSSSPDENLHLDLSIANTGGGGIKLAYVGHSVVRISLLANAGLYTGNTHPLTTGITYATGVDPSVVVEGYIDPTITTPISGAVIGTLRTNLREDLAGEIKTYNGIATAAVGMPAIYAAADPTAQGAAISNTVIYTPPANGRYRVSAYIVVTQAATTSSTMPAVNVGYTCADNSTAQSIPLTSTSAGNTLTTLASGSAIIDAKGGVPITFSASGYASSGATPMQYALHIRVEAL
ncbi:MAG: glycosyl hydrolase family 28-related protein [Nitrospiraceae bacterium]|nr:glycosyl hydrolase family 28-related protein [Nitrospiraceae bacterium]